MIDAGASSVPLRAILVFKVGGVIEMTEWRRPTLATTGRTTSRAVDERTYQNKDEVTETSVPATSRRSFFIRGP
ncbi:hypothetical protein MRX96_044354 [Rhipicephalus microplus]